MNSLFVERLKNIIWQVLLVSFAVLIVLFVVESVSFYFLNYHVKKGSLSKWEKQLPKLYPGQDLQEIKKMLSETWRNNAFVYEPFVEYSNREFHGEFFNIQEHGYRSGEKLPWPPPSNSIFIFGGSTALGIGVKDSETISSYLEKALDNKSIAYNFSTPAQYSTIERIRFFKFITQNIKPDIAIFIDGLNDFYFYQIPDRSNYSNRLELASDFKISYILKKFISKFNTVKLLFYFLNKNVEDLYFRYKASEAELNKTLNRLVVNREIIGTYCKHSQIDCIFVTQPVPTFAYDNRQRPIKVEPKDLRGAINCKIGYELLEAYYSKNKMINHIDLSMLKSEEPMYVDSFHYSAKMNHLIAKELACYIRNLE